MAKRILCFFGTRPEAIKMAPVVKRLQADKAFDVRVAVSAQHRDMLDQVLRIFKVRANVDLNLMKKGQTLTDITVDVLRRFEPVLKRIKPDLVLVHGDTTTTFAGTLASFYQKIPVGHVEAGLRTRDLFQPYPEEANRRLADALCALYFAPTSESRKNLLNDNAKSERIFVTGNTVIDALLWTAAGNRPVRSPALKTALQRAGHKPLILMTAHRRENFGAPFERIFSAIRQLSSAFPHHHWIYPVHPNPNVAGPARRRLGGLPNVHLMAPLDYGDLVSVLKRSVLVVTDSGGLQEEAPSLGKPVLVLREVTERPEAVKAGTVELVGTNPARLKKAVTSLLSNPRVYRRMANAVNPYGDGRAAERIHQAIRWYFGMGRRPGEFSPR